MYLHIGNDIILDYDNIIAILDIENTTISKITRNFLNNAQKKGMVINVSDDMPKSFVVAKIEDDNFVYISNISSVTLLKRIGEPFGSEDIINYKESGGTYGRSNQE